MACVICEKIAEKKALFVYEDEQVAAIAPSKPAAPGHIRILPKQHYTKLDEMPDQLVERLFAVANQSSAAGFEVTGSHGSNIILNEGAEHLAIDAIPRKENDGLNFTWQPKQLSQPDFDGVFSKIKDKAFGIGAKEKKAPVVVSQERKAEVITPLKPREAPAQKPEIRPAAKETPEPESENYMVKNLTRIP